MSSINELLHRLLYAGLPRSRYSVEEIEAAKAEFDRKMIALGDAANEFNAVLTRVRERPDPSLPPALIRELEEDRKDTERRFYALRTQRDFLGDYLIILSHRPIAQRQAAVERIADRLEDYGPFTPDARAALAKVARKRGETQPAVIRETKIHAICLVCEDAEGSTDRRQGRQWIKDSEGERVEFTPARQFGPGSSEFFHWFGCRVRELVEAELIADAGLQDREEGEVIPGLLPGEPTGSYRQGRAGRRALAVIEDDGEDDGDLDPALSLMIDELTPEERDVLERSEQGGLDSRDRKRLQRLRDRLIRKIS